MKLFDEWVTEAAYDVVGDEAEAMMEAFRAGMLAAADIAWPKDGEAYVLDDYDEGKQQASMDIREAAE